MFEYGSEDGPPMTIPVDPQLSFRWNLAAAKQEHVDAMSDTGLAYEIGNGVEQNYISAFEWYTKAAEKGDKNAQCNLGYCYEHGRGEVEIDLEQAMFWYRKSAAQEFQQAMDAVQRLNHNQLNE